MFGGSTQNMVAQGVCDTKYQVKYLYSTIMKHAIYLHNQL